MNTTKRFGLLLLLALACLGGNAFAQNPAGKSKGLVAPNLLRPEYYAAIDFMEDGQFAQAITALESALAQSRSLNNEKGIDSIPVLVMLGECYWEQCEIGLALDKYDAALELSTRSMRWLSLLRSPTAAIRPDTRTRDITWLPNTRGTQMGTFPDGWPIAIASSEVLVELQGVNGGEGKIVSIDALEILRCQAIALRRRYLLLGPLITHNPITKNLAESFRQKVDGLSEPIACAMNICRGLAELGVQKQPEAVRLLKQNLSLSSGLDHPLTPIALLALADLSIESNQIVDAEDRARDASLASARAGQMGMLAESIEHLSEAGFVDGHDAMVAKTLPLIANWANNRSRLVTIRAQVEWARLAALMGDIEGFRKHSTVATTMLLPKQISLPRAEAVLRYARAKIEFLEGKTSDGVNSLLESIAYLRGPSNGFGSAPLYQLRLAESLISENVFQEDVAKSVLQQLLRSPAAGHWRVQPLEQLCWLIADKSIADRLLIDISLQTSSDSEWVSIFDHALARRYRQTGALESRMLDLQLAFHARDPNWVGVHGNALAAIRSQVPALQRNADLLEELVVSLKQNPKWEVKNWNEEDVRQWDAVTKLSDAQESLQWAAAIGPLDVPELFPPRHDPEEFAKKIRVDDAVVMFVFHGDDLRGFLYQDKAWTAWTVAKPDQLRNKMAEYANSLFQLKSNSSKGQSVLVGWPVGKRMELRNALFPDPVWAKLQLAKRWIVVPDGDLWNFPFESLPVSDRVDALPTVASRRIVFSPTLGLVPKICSVPRKKATKRALDVVSGGFLSKNVARSKQLKNEIGMESNRVLIDVASKMGSHPSSRYLRTIAEEVCTYSGFAVAAVSPIPTDVPAEKSLVQTWRLLPWACPSRLLLPGVDAMTSQGQNSGDDLFRLVMPLIAQGSNEILLSRFPVGGDSTVAMLRAYRENNQEMSSSEAFQRSVLTLWEEQLNPSFEVVFSTDASDDPGEVVPGSHPLLWSGYMLIGDSE